MEKEAACKEVLQLSDLRHRRCDEEYARRGEIRVAMTVGQWRALSRTIASHDVALASEGGLRVLRVIGLATRWAMLFAMGVELIQLLGLYIVQRCEYRAAEGSTKKQIVAIFSKRSRRAA